MNAGRRTDLITFEARVITDLPSGEKQITWSAEASAGGFQEWAEALRQSETAAQFTIVYRSGITPASHRIIWEGAIWDIVNSIPDRKRTELVLSADFSSLIEVTHLQSVDREFISANPIIRPPE